MMEALLVFYPMHRTLNCVLPVGVEFISLIHAHFRLKLAIQFPELCEFVRTVPESNTKTADICRTKRGHLYLLGPTYGDLQDVRLELHHKISAAGAAIAADEGDFGSDGFSAAQRLSAME